MLFYQSDKMKKKRFLFCDTIINIYFFGPFRNISWRHLENIQLKKNKLSKSINFYLIL